MCWVYVKSEEGLFTTGFYDPQGVWHPDLDHATREAASDRVNFLNGGNTELLKELVNSVLYR